MTSIDEEIANRQAEFHDCFGGQEFLEEDLIEATERLWGATAVIYGDQAADRAFDTLVGAVFPGAAQRGGWRAELEMEANGMYSDTPGGTLLHDLTAYADYGLVLTPCRSVQERRQVLEAQVDRGMLLLQFIRLKLNDQEASPVRRIVMTAHSRWKLDSGQPLNKHDLSRLSGLAEQSIRNRLSGRSREIRGTTERVEAAEAAAWLSVQKKFVTSLWQHQDDVDLVASYDLAIADPVFAPIAPDNTMFHPGLKTDGVYVVGELGFEQSFESYLDALSALQQMRLPVWRRRSDSGRLMPVKGMTWTRIDRAELAQVC